MNNTNKKQIVVGLLVIFTKNLKTIKTYFVMEKSIFKMEHFENGIKEFETNNDFILFVQSVYIENEDWMELEEPKTIEDCVGYVRDYCDNLKMIEI